MFILLNFQPMESEPIYGSEPTYIVAPPAAPLRVRIKKLHPDAVVPVKAHPSDAGFDLTAVSVEYDSINGCIVYHTGLAFEIPAGYVGLIYPRSSIFKKNLLLTNHTGVLDSGYRGEVLAKFKRIGRDPRLASVYDVGERIAQLVIMPYPAVEFVEGSELSDTDRGAGGYGSTGA